MIDARGATKKVKTANNQDRYAQLGDRFPAIHLVRSSWFAGVLARILLLVMVLMTIAAIFVPWQQTSKGEGQVIARLPQLRSQTVTSPSKGVLSFIASNLREGSLVEEGELIMEIAPFSANQVELSQSQVRSIESQLFAVQMALNNAQLQIETTRIQGSREIERAEADVEASRNKWQQSIREYEGQEPILNQAKLERERSEELKESIVPLVEFKALEAKEKSEFKKLEKLMFASDESFNDLQGKERSLEAKKQEVEQKILKAKGDAAKSSAEASKTQKELDELRAKVGEFDRLKVRSPSRGRIQAILGQAGTDTVKEGDKLFEVVPETDDLAVELTIRGVDAPLIHVGDTVRLQFEGWPAIQFVGWPSVAVGTFPAEVIAINPTDVGKGIFRIVVGPVQNRQDSDSATGSAEDRGLAWPDSRYLRQGVRANGWVILRTVPLGYEIWRQLNGFPISISDSEPNNSKSDDPKMPKLK